MLKSFILKTFLFATCIFFFKINLVAQKKDFTEEELLKNKMPLVVVPMPVIISWNDDDHLVLGRKVHPDSIARQFLLDPKTGKEMLLENPGNITQPATGKSVYAEGNDLYFKQGGNAAIRLTNDSAKEINPTFSPDSSYVAYTKNNNLYVAEISSKIEKQLTFDGNDSLMNGYASWLYTEEILGRSSHYRAFWWSPDSHRRQLKQRTWYEIPVQSLAWLFFHKSNT